MNTTYPDPPRPHESVPSPEVVLRSADILQGRREIQIEHAGQMYRLIVTRNGKLLLQK